MSLALLEVCVPACSKGSSKDERHVMRTSLSAQRAHNIDSFFLSRKLGVFDFYYWQSKRGTKEQQRITSPQHPMA